MMGRNYDYRHSTADGKSYKSIAAILVHTAPAGGKRSISMVDGMNLGYGKGFYTDGTTDLSLLMGLPYAALDGINEDALPSVCCHLTRTRPTSRQASRALVRRQL